MKAWCVVVLACLATCLGCTRAEPKSSHGGLGVVRAEPPAATRDGQLWQPLVPQTEYERDREIYRDFENGLGGLQAYDRH